MSNQVTSPRNKIRITHSSRQKFISSGQQNFSNTNKKNVVDYIPQQYQFSESQNNYSFNQNMRYLPQQSKQKNNKKQREFNKFAQQFINQSKSPRIKHSFNQQQTVSINQLAKKLQKHSTSVFSTLYGQAFYNNKDYIFNISKIKSQQNIDKMVLYYTKTVYEIVQIQGERYWGNTSKYGISMGGSNNRFGLSENRSNELIVEIKKEERKKLKLMFTSENQGTQKNKNFQSYIKKIEEQTQKYKRQYIQIKQKNRNLQNQIIKISLEFKNKRQLYLVEIGRLTQILHASFMEVGKMFVNNVQGGGPANFNNYNINLQNPYNQYNFVSNSQNFNEQIKKSFIKPLNNNISTSNYDRKNVKSLSNYKLNKGEYNSPDVKNSYSPKNSLKPPQIGKSSLHNNLMTVDDRPQLRKVGSQNNDKKLFESASNNNLTKSSQYKGFQSTIMNKRNFITDLA